MSLDRPSRSQGVALSPSIYLQSKAVTASVKVRAGARWQIVSTKELVWSTLVALFTCGNLFNRSGLPLNRFLD